MGQLWPKSSLSTTTTTNLPFTGPTPTPPQNILYIPTNNEGHTFVVRRCSNPSDLQLQVQPQGSLRQQTKKTLQPKKKTSSTGISTSSTHASTKRPISSRTSLRTAKKTRATDVQWRVENAEGADWLYITTNSNWSHFETEKSLWAILRTYDVDEEEEEVDDGEDEQSFEGIGEQAEHISR